MSLYLLSFFVPIPTCSPAPAPPSLVLASELFQSEYCSPVVHGWDVSFCLLQAFLQNEDLGNSSASAKALLQKHEEFEEAFTTQEEKITVRNGPWFGHRLHVCAHHLIQYLSLESLLNIRYNTRIILKGENTQKKNHTHFFISTFFIPQGILIKLLKISSHL